MALEVINPATSEVVDKYEEMDAETIRKRIAAAQCAHEQWRKTKMSARADLLRETAAILESEKNSFAALMAMEMGKPVRAGRAEIKKCAWVCRHYAEEAAQMLAPEEVQTSAKKSYVTFNPIGVVLAVMPWNYPFWQVFRFSAPALMSGNAALLKHASNVPGCALAIETILHQSGSPRVAFSKPF